MFYDNAVMPPERSGQLVLEILPGKMAKQSNPVKKSHLHEPQPF